MHIDIMNIPMTKQKETFQFVWYKIEITIVSLEGGSGFSYKYGVFKFDKLRELEKETFENVIEFVREETDPILWDHKKILIKCLVKMVECKKNDFFPDKVHYACG